MNEKFTQEDSVRLAEIIWWIKGVRAAVDASNDILSDFDEDHVNALRKARLILRPD
jgi:hypothetical protein